MWAVPMAFSSSRMLPTTPARGLMPMPNSASWKASGPAPPGVRGGGVGDLDRAAAGEADGDGGLQEAQAGDGAVDGDDASPLPSRGRSRPRRGQVAEGAGLGEIADVAVDGAAADVERESVPAGW